VSDKKNTELTEALMGRLDLYNDAVDRFRELAEKEEDYRLTRALREAVELTRCLRRLVESSDINAVYRAFGAPGDFGYETPIGDALRRLYWKESER
jgi:hypothetical protein